MWNKYHVSFLLRPPIGYLPPFPAQPDLPGGEGGRSCSQFLHQQQPVSLSLLVILETTFLGDTHAPLLSTQPH